MLTKAIRIPLLLTVIAALGFCSWMMKDGYFPVDETNPKLSKLKLQPGFVAEHLYGPSEHQQGSWVSMAFDDKGRLIACDQYGYLYRLIIPPIGAPADQKVKVEKLVVGLPSDSIGGKVGVGYANGLLYAFNSLYVVVNTRGKQTNNTSGLYRLQDTNGDDQFDKVTLLKKIEGDGEHGPHSVILSPDGKSLYVVAGNHTDLPAMDAYYLPKNWGDDNLFPLIRDPRGHAVDRMAPAGWIAKTDPDGKKWDLVSAGYRNPYDIAFNEAGDLFTYDSDMEWEFGLPWYRPTRICHSTSGSEFGWRSGAPKWSPSYADNLPPIKNIGQGSPTNLVYVNKARFPRQYKNTLFAFDWSFGIVHALHLKPDGGTYSAERTEFLSGVPLPLTDGVIGPDGALYFMTGGRRLESDVYRVYYKDYKSIAPDANVVAPVLTPENKLRRELEAFHGKTDPGAVNFAWPHLSHPDRFVRYAARIAVENQPVSEWQKRALAEKDPQRAIYAALALARQGGKDIENPTLNVLAGINFASLSEGKKLDLLRAMEVMFFRKGEPDAATKARLLKYLQPQYPGSSALQNRALVKVLVFLQSPQVIEKTLALMEKTTEPGMDAIDTEMATSSADLINRNPQYGLSIADMLSKLPPAQQTYYAFALTSQKEGWTKAQREKYFKWFDNAFSYRGGNSYVGFIEKARQLALAHVPKNEQAYYNKLSGGEKLAKSGNDLIKEYAIKGPGRGWNLKTADSVINSGMKGVDFETGKQIYGAVMCNRCHAIGGEGEGIGPDLTQLGTRFSGKDILDAIISPNKVVSDQYASTVFKLKNGESVVGRLIREDEKFYIVSQNPFALDVLEKVAKKDVVSRDYSPVSVMLPGLINGLNPDELKHLIAYLMAGGNKSNQIYAGGK